MKREKAVAVGNRAGIVEWANASWSRVTGFALEDAIAKPVSDLLGQAGIDRDLLDFVRRHFERGEPCEIELEVAPPGDAPRRIHVSVESLHDRHGEVSHFAAIAWNVTDEAPPELARPGSQAEAAERAVPAPSALALASTPTDLSAFVRDVVRRQDLAGAVRTVFDLDLPDGLPPVRLDREAAAGVLEGLLAEAARAIGDEWGTVSVSTGVARNEALFVSPSYPRDCLLRGLECERYGFIEVHDTGPPASRGLLEGLAGEPEVPRGGRAGRLAAARAVLQAHGGALRVDADPGFGTRVILLFPG